MIVAAGLQTPSRLAQSAGLAWANGIAVEPHTLRTSEERIHAMGDCITLDGQASRFIEPIARQAKTIAAAITACEPVPYEAQGRGGPGQDHVDAADAALNGLRAPSRRCPRPKLPERTPREAFSEGIFSF